MRAYRGTFHQIGSCVEMAWVNLWTEDASILDTGYVLATLYYLSEDWMETFNVVYGSSLKNGSDQALTGWTGMYVVEYMTVAGGTSHYLFGYAYDYAYDNGAGPHLYYTDDFAVTSIKPTNADVEALWTDETRAASDLSEDGSFTFDTESVETARVDLTTANGDIGYVFATFYHITEEWADKFNGAYAGENAVQASTGGVLTGWCDMYVVEYAYEDESGEAVTEHYLYGYAYDSDFGDGVLYRHYLHMEEE